MIRHRFRAAPHLVSGLVLAAAVLTGVGGSAAGQPETDAVVARAPALPSTALARRSVAAPVRVRIPVLGVDAVVVPVEVEPSGELHVPDDPRIVGWWRAGGQPGAPGAAGVLDGHVDTARDGPGALFHIAALKPGDTVVVQSSSGASTAFVVRSVRHYAKAVLPPGVFSAGPTPQLVLITCGGRFDHFTRQYSDNVVVVAVTQS